MVEVNIDPLVQREFDFGDPRLNAQFARLLRQIEKHGPHSALETTTTDTALRGSDDTNVDDPEPVATNGNFAYLGDGDTFRIMDVEDPDNPTLVGSVSDANLQDIEGVVLSDDGTEAYIASDASPQLVTLDISDETAPTVQGTLSLAGTFEHSRHIAGPIGDHVFLITGQTDEVHSVDISTLGTPTLADTLTHSSIDEPEVLIAQGNRLYVFSDQGTAATRRLTIIDITDPTAMSVLGNVQSPNAIVPEAMVVDTDGDHVYVKGNSRVEVYDVTTASAPTLAGTVTSDSMDGSGASRTAALQNDVFIVPGHEGGTTSATLTSVDISDPTDPTVQETFVFGTDDPSNAFALSDDGKFIYATEDGGFVVIQLSDDLGGGIPLTADETTYDIDPDDGTDEVAARRDHTHGTQPSVPDPYSPSNVTEDRTFDADSTTTAELADVLGTLINDLIEQGILNAP